MTDTNTIAPVDIFVNGVAAFRAGDAVPAEHAKRLGLNRRKNIDGPIYATADSGGIHTVTLDEAVAVEATAEAART